MAARSRAARPGHLPSADADVGAPNLRRHFFEPSARNRRWPIDRNESREAGTMRVLLLLAAVLTVALTLSACQGDYASGDVEKYKRAHDRYMDSYEPKTGSHL